MIAHTPGPWLVATSNSWRRILASDGSHVCQPVTQKDGHPDLLFANGGQDGPDARLIAAAPDLLAALLSLLSDWDSVCGSHGWEKNHLCGPVDARAAIAKATGVST